MRRMISGVSETTRIAVGGRPVLERIMAVVHNRSEAMVMRNSVTCFSYANGCFIAT